MSKPIGISAYELTRALPARMKSALPTVEEIEAELEAASSKVVKQTSQQTGGRKKPRVAKHSRTRK